MNFILLTNNSEKQNKYNEISKNNFSAEAKRVIHLNKTSNNDEDKSKEIYLSKLYRLPILLKNNNNSMQFNTINKMKINKSKIEEVLRENSTNNFNHKIKQISPLDSSAIKKSYEMRTRISDDKNKDKNINIHFINYNKISLIKKDLGLIKLTGRKNDSDNKSKENNNGFSDLENLLKDKFYVDTEARMRKKINDRDFNIDHSLKDKIIEMNKIGDFWGVILNYCNPLFTIKRYKYITDELRKKKVKKNLNNDNDNETVNEFKKRNNNKSEIKKNGRQIKSPNLYTLNSLSSSKHNNKLRIKKEFLEKYNDFSHYYLH